ncbi:AMP-binding protein [Cognatiluteimonas weifangensis]|uniref:AMP-ligase n=1 Tax=Cognatiluteimonas weifangensis TaxID=2303539 RepID=A0A372DHD3_9GAMM|nr:AMP-binding protein [Luteimonas weifangensis]RFP58933.1 AMP-ligase [Luteimonas weifangensis]
MSAVVDDIAGIAGRSAAPVALAVGAATRTLAFGPSGTVTLGRFLGQVQALAARLPEAPHAINLCEDRYRFLVAFCAAAVRGQVTLLPPSRAPAAVAEVAQRHPGSYRLDDAAVASAEPDPGPTPPLPQAEAAPLRIDRAALAAIGFTSGSTGVPAPNPKTWDSLRTSTAQNLAALRDLWPAGTPVHLVATVPPQHMYGMELSVLLPLLAEVAVHAGRPFFPHDIAHALRQAPAPRLLVTTPVHLRALVQACAADPGLRVPPLAGIVSATAPLPAALAAAAEARLGCEVRELFGSTETCVIARRRSARDEAWTPFPGVRLQPQPDGSLVHAPQLPAPALLADLVEIVDAAGRFRLRGRQADLLEIAGKRASLDDLTRRLQAVPGVVDGVVFQLDAAAAGGVRRIAALAVAPTLTPAAILQALRQGIDPVFLPRPLRCVAALPRNPTGKLPRAALLALLQTASD